MYEQLEDAFRQDQQRKLLEQQKTQRGESNRKARRSCRAGGLPAAGTKDERCKTISGVEEEHSCSSGNVDGQQFFPPQHFGQINRVEDQQSGGVVNPIESNEECCSDAVEQEQSVCTEGD